jgi:hypothetical protein
VEGRRDFLGDVANLPPSGPSNRTKSSFHPKKASLIDEIYFAIILFHASFRPGFFPFNPFFVIVERCFVPKRSFSINDITFYSSLRKHKNTHHMLCVFYLLSRYAKEFFLLAAILLLLSSPIARPERRKIYGSGTAQDIAT